MLSFLIVGANFMVLYVLSCASYLFCVIFDVGDNIIKPHAPSPILNTTNDMFDEDLIVALRLNLFFKWHNLLIPLACTRFMHL